MLQLSIQRVKKLNFLMPQISALGSSHFSTMAEPSSSSKRSAPRVPNLIGGRFLDSKASNFIDVINPATQEVVSQVPLTTDEEFKAVVSAAKKAFPLWRYTPVTTRQRVMLKLQELIRRYMDILNVICDDDDIKAISFVGSNVAGMHIYSRAAAKGKRVQSNMGAKNHAIVMPDANVDATVNALTDLCSLQLLCWHFFTRSDLMLLL